MFSDGLWRVLRDEIKMKEELKIKFLSDLIDFKNGKSIKPSSGNIPIYGGNGILGYSEKYNYNNILIIGRVGAYCGSIHYHKEECWVSDNAIAGEVKSDYSIDYLYYLIKSLNLNDRQVGSSQPLLTQGVLNNISVKIYESSQTQQSIAAILSALDKKIALNKQINARLEEVAKTLYDYWFVQFDFPDANGNPYKSSGGEMVFDETLKREIPKGWEVKSLNQVADIVMGQSPDGASYNLEQEGTIFFQGSTDFDWRFPNVRQYTTSPTRFAQKGDILLSVRAPVGDLNISPFECCIGRGLAALRSKSGNNSFLFYVMKYFKTVFERRNTEGTTFGSITKDDLHSLKLVAPADNVLEKYNEIASKYDEMIFIRSQQNHHLTQLRDFLLPMLMNGQVSVAK